MIWNSLKRGTRYELGLIGGATFSGLIFHAILPDSTLLFAGGAKTYQINPNTIAWVRERYDFNAS